ncbi:cytochrome b [Parapedomonas caeni]|jgi:cytochrome b561
MTTTSAAASRYSTVAVILHWLIALAIIGLLVAGFVMGDLLHSDNPADKQLGFKIIQLHKSLGLTVLVLTLVRLAWRIGHKPPALPASMKPWERKLSVGTHHLFYLLMLGLPLSGWALVSTSSLGLPTMWFDLFAWPNIGFLADMAADARKAVHESLEEAHELLAFAIIGLLILHVAAALKHHLIDRDDVMARMVPWLRGR